MKRLLVVLLFVVFCFALTCSTFATFQSYPQITIRSVEEFVAWIESENKEAMLSWLVAYSDDTHSLLDPERKLLVEKIEQLQEEGIFVPKTEEEPKTVSVECSTRGCVEYSYYYGSGGDNPVSGLHIEVDHYDPQVRDKLKNTEELFHLVFGAVYNFELDKERPYELRINGTPCTAYYLKKPGTTVVAEYEGFMIQLSNVGNIEKYAESFDLSFSGEIRPAFIDEAFGASATYWWFVLPAVGAVVGCGLTLAVLFVIRKKKKSK